MNIVYAKENIGSTAMNIEDEMQGQYLPWIQQTKYWHI